MTEVALKNYTLISTSACGRCGQQVDSWRTPGGKTFLADHGQETSHWQTCKGKRKLPRANPDAFTIERGAGLKRKHALITRKVFIFCQHGEHDNCCGWFYAQGEVSLVICTCKCHYRFEKQDAKVLTSRV